MSAIQRLTCPDRDVCKESRVYLQTCCLCKLSAHRGGQTALLLPGFHTQAAGCSFTSGYHVHTTTVVWTVQPLLGTLASSECPGQKEGRGRTCWARGEKSVPVHPVLPLPQSRAREPEGLHICLGTGLALCTLGLRCHGASPFRRPAPWLLEQSPC